MIHLNRPAIPAVATVFNSLTNGLGVIAFIAIVTFSQQSHATNIWLWSWLAISGVQTVRGSEVGPAKEAVDIAHLAKAPKKSTAVDDSKPASHTTVSTKSPA